MAEEEKKEISIVVSSCTEKTGGDGNKYWEVKCTIDGNDETFYCKEDLGTGPMKVTRYGEKKSIYKIKQGGGASQGGDQEWVEKDVEIKSCTPSGEYQGTQYYEVVAIVDGVEGLYTASKAPLEAGIYKCSIGKSKNPKYAGFLKKAKSKGGWGGKSTSYSLEQEAMKDALGIVAPLFIAGAYKDKDGHPLPPTSENLKGAATKVAGIIIEGYKKPD